MLSATTSVHSGEPVRSRCGAGCRLPKRPCYVSPEERRQISRYIWDRLPAEKLEITLDVHEDPFGDEVVVNLKFHGGLPEGFPAEAERLLVAVVREVLPTARMGVYLRDVESHEETGPDGQTITVIDDAKLESVSLLFE